MINAKHNIPILLICFIMLSASFLINKERRFGDPIIHDEGYHVTDDLVSGNNRALNPFAAKYSFLGHPPGYPLSMYAWLNLTEKSSLGAKYYQATFSLLVVFIFMMIVFLATNVWIAVVAGFMLLNNQIFSMQSTLCLADIPGLFFLLLCLYFLKAKQWIPLLVAQGLLLFFRESGVAFSVALVFVGLLLKRRGSCDLYKRYVCSGLIGVGIVFLFYALNFFFRGAALNHPYASGSLSHTKVTFFSLSKYKLNGLFFIQESLQESFPGYFGILVIMGVFLVFNFRKKQPFTREQLVFIVTTFFFVAFFGLYGDSLVRDVLVVIPLVIYLASYTLHYLFKNYGAIVMLAIAFAPTGQFYETSYYKEKIEVMKRLDDHIIETYGEKTRMCSSYPFLASLSNKVHGFKSAGRYQVDCDTPDTLLFFGEEKTFKKLFDLVKTNNLRLVKTIPSKHKNNRVRIFSKVR